MNIKKRIAGLEITFVVLCCIVAVMFHKKESNLDLPTVSIVIVLVGFTVIRKLAPRLNLESLCIEMCPSGLELATAFVGWKTIFISAAVSVVLMVVAYFNKTLNVMEPAVSPLVYIPFAFLQQLALVYAYRRFRYVAGKAMPAQIITALIFSMMHLPNKPLMLMTLIGGLWFVYLFERYKNLYLVFCTHALLGWTLAVSFSVYFDRLRIGWP